MDGDVLHVVRVNLANDHSASPGDRIGVAHNRVVEHVEEATFFCNWIVMVIMTEIQIAIRLC